MLKDTRSQGIQNRTGFSLIELIVVIAIMGIISTIGTQSFMSYLESSRDATRATNLTTISTLLEEYGKINGFYPTPDSAQVFYYQSESSPVWSQGTVGNTTSLALRFSSKRFDPIYKDTEYSYSVTANGKQYELGSVYESTDNVTASFVPSALALTNTFPAVALLVGNYNQLFVSATSSTGNILLISSPSITRSDFTVLDLASSFFSTGSYVIHGKKNIPASYNKNPLTMSGNFYLAAPLLLTSFTGALSSGQITTIMESTKNAYFGTILNSNNTLWNKTSTYASGSTDQSSLGASAIVSLMEGSYNMRKTLTTFSITPSQITTSPPTTSIISYSCLIAPTSFTSSNPAVASISGTGITAVSTGSIIISINGGNCIDTTPKTLKVN